MTVKSESKVAQSCLTLSDPTDCSLPGSSVHGFSSQEYWSGVPLPSPFYFLDANNAPPTPSCDKLSLLLLSCLTLCDPMDYIVPGSFILHYLLEFAQTRVH